MLFINTHFTGDYAECHYRDLYFHRNLKSLVNPGKNSEKINSRIKWRANL